MSNHIDTLPHKKPCGCPEPTGSRAELDALIQRYKNLIRQTEAERDTIADAFLALGNVAMEAKATLNKEEILQAIRNIDIYSQLTDDELDAIVNGEEEEESGEQEEAETQVDTRPRIEAYNAGLDVRKELRRVSYNTSLHVATWEDSTTGDNWYTNYPYELGGNVWDNSNIYSALAWGVISLISE